MDFLRIRTAVELISIHIWYTVYYYIWCQCNGVPEKGKIKKMKTDDAFLNGEGEQNSSLSSDGDDAGGVDSYCQ